LKFQRFFCSKFISTFFFEKFEDFFQRFLIGGTKRFSIEQRDLANETHC
jgi:hypothetical protein